MKSLLSFFRPSRQPAPKGPTSSIRPALEALEDRCVPAVVDLTTAGSPGAANGALFLQANPQPTGCGVIHDFLRIQATGVEQGYNTSARPLQFDEKQSPVFTRDLQLSEAPDVAIDGVNYHAFLLGINQSSDNPLLSLDELRIYVSSSPGLTGYDAGSHQLATLKPVYDMGASNSVLLDARLSHGNGSGDMFLYVPDTAFAGAGPDSFVYLYSKFGVTAAGNGGFEQWAVPSVATAPALSSLSGFVYLDANHNGIFDSGDSGLGNMTVTLTGTNVLGQTVNVTTTTRADGSYSFIGLLAGTYSLRETTVNDGFRNGTDNVGSQGGSVATDLIFNINLKPGVAGVNNNFGELSLFGGS